ncbi:MAG: hypothetical protein QW692_03155 [Nitrososphaerota archaeon]
MMGAESLRENKRAHKGRPSKADRLFLILKGLGGVCRLEELMDEARTLEAFCPKTLRNYIKSLDKFAAPSIDNIKILTVTKSRFFGRTYIHFAYKLAPPELANFIMLLLSNMLWKAEVCLNLIRDNVFVDLSCTLIVIAVICRYVLGKLAVEKNKIYEPPEITVFYKDYPEIFREKFDPSDMIKDVKKRAFENVRKRYGINEKLELVPREEKLEKECYRLKQSSNSWDKTRLYELQIMLYNEGKKGPIIFDLKKLPK